MAQKHRVVPEDVEVYLKLESFNPGGSVKGRPALYMITAAERQGLLNPDSVIVEPTSGTQELDWRWCVR